MEKKSPASGNRAQIPNFKSQIPFFFLIALLSLAFTFTMPGEKKETGDEHVRKAAVAGGFYPGDKAALEEYVDMLLRQANPPKIEGSIRAIMVPARRVYLFGIRRGVRL